MSEKRTRPLSAGYSSTFDSVDQQSWCQLVTKFDDGNIYQTWPYATVVGGGDRNTSHMIVKRDGEVVAIAMCRIKRLPLLNVGVAYAQWGPIWRRTGAEANIDVFRQAVRALHNEFVCRRGLTLRLFPIVFHEGPFESILTDEGFSSVKEAARGRTILMDMRPAITELREGMKPHWKRELKVAEKNKLELVGGSSEELFDEFISMYKEMVSRKKFLEPNDIHQFKRIQEQLPEALKMQVLLCRSGENMSAGAIYSQIGDSAIYLFGATSNAGMKSRGSYFLQWKIVEALKARGTGTYNLNGINPMMNPGTYKFKNDLAGKYGKDVYYAGRFDAHAGSLGASLVRFADTLRLGRRKLKSRIVSPKGETQTEQQREKASAT